MTKYNFLIELDTETHIERATPIPVLSDPIAHITAANWNRLSAKK
jgi:hypothetical protein